MTIVIDTNFYKFLDKLGITSSRFNKNYGLSNIDEIIEAEAAQGNDKAFKYLRECNYSPEKLIKLLRLACPENKFQIIKDMKYTTRIALMELLEPEDLVIGLNFFTQDALLGMLMRVKIEELVAVAKDAFSLEEIVTNFDEEDLKLFMQHRELEKNIIIEQLKEMPSDMLQKFIENVTGQQQEDQFTLNYIDSLKDMPDDKFKEFMSLIDPDVQRQLTYQLIKNDENYLLLFEHEAYVKMLSKTIKPEMVKSLIMLNKETMLKMVDKLPDSYQSIIASQIETTAFAGFLQKGRMDLVERALIL